MRVPVSVSALVLAVSAVAGLGILSAQQNPYVGRWNITGTGSDSSKVYFLEVKQNGDTLEGLFLDRGGHATPVSWIKVEDGELQWQHGGGSDTLPKPACGPLYRAKIEAGKLIGHHETPGVPCRNGGASRRRRRPRHTTLLVCQPRPRRTRSTGSACASRSGRPPTPTASTPTARRSSSSDQVSARTCGQA